MQYKCSNSYNITQYKTHNNRDLLHFTIANTTCPTTVLFKWDLTAGSDSGLRAALCRIPVDPADGFALLWHIDARARSHTSGIFRCLCSWTDRSPLIGHPDIRTDPADHNAWLKCKIQDYCGVNSLFSTRDRANRGSGPIMSGKIESKHGKRHLEALLHGTFKTAGMCRECTF